MTPSLRHVDVTCARSGTADVVARLHTSLLTPCDVGIKGHSYFVVYLIQWPLLPMAIDLLCAEHQFMATFRSPMTSSQCVFRGFQGKVGGNNWGSQWVNSPSWSNLLFICIVEESWSSFTEVNWLNKPDKSRNNLSLT